MKKVENRFTLNVASINKLTLLLILLEQSNANDTTSKF